ncbi:MAG TPA: hypothetical protein VFT50_09380 [Baekduia sp.]|nr:hypothetical protein [Baekduia sp.]
MAQIDPTLPTVGQPNSTEDADIVSAFQAILALVNGGLDDANIANGANIDGAKLLAHSVGTTQIAAVESAVITGSAFTLTPVVYKDVTGRIHFGTDEYDLGSSVPAGGTLLTLPVGFRPGATKTGTLMQLTTAGGATPIHVRIGTGGNVVAPYKSLTPAAGTFYTFSALTWL